MQSVPPRILICDDDAPFRERLVRALRLRGIDVCEASSAEEAVMIARQQLPTGAIVDLRMPGQSGLWLVSELAAAVPGIKTVVFTGFGSIATALEAVRRGAVNYVTKPASIESLLKAFAPEVSDATADVQMPPLAEVESEYIHRVLAEKDGNVSVAAKALGIHRRSLQRWLKRS